MWPTFAIIAALAAAAPVQGALLLTQVRYAAWYGYDRNAGFNTNPVARIPFDSGVRVGAASPSQTEAILVNSLDFPQEPRPVETRIFHGRLHVPEKCSGVYRFRVTSDDASDMFVDKSHVLANPGVHFPKSVEAVVHLKPDTNHEFELWWGNVGGGGSLKVEYCHDALATLKAKSAGALSTMEGAPSLSDLDLGDGDVSESCNWSTDLSEIFVKHENVPGILRCDYDGYWDNGDLSKDTRGQTTRFMSNGPCAVELGGVIHMAPSGAETDATWGFLAYIKPRVTGTHTFWLLSDDGSVLTLDDEIVVENPGVHGALSQQGSIFLEEGKEYKLEVVYGNKGAGGILKVHWTDPLTPQPQASLAPILQPII